MCGSGNGGPTSERWTGVVRCHNRDLHRQETCLDSLPCVAHRASDLNRDAMRDVKKRNVARYHHESDDGKLGTLVMSLCPETQINRGHPCRCPASHQLCFSFDVGGEAGLQHGVRMRDMRLDHLEAALDCAGVADWREKEKAWIERQTDSKSKKRWRLHTLAPRLLSAERTPTPRELD